MTVSRATAASRVTARPARRSAISVSICFEEEARMATGTYNEKWLMADG